jgi:putative tryptophan/tyrosine transport system substrate-binding protein
VRRRDFITLLGGSAAAWPLAVRAQQGGGIARIGVLMPSAEGESEWQARIAAFRAMLEKLGWSEGRNIRFDYRWGAGNAERARTSAAELISLTPNVILATNSVCVEALGRATRAIPIVFVNVSDPLASGLVRSMARPGENLTGFVNYVFSIGGKWLGLLKEAAPAIKRVLVIGAPGNIGITGFLKAINEAAPALGVRPVAAQLLDAADIERAIEAFAQEPNGGLMVLPGVAGLNNLDRIVGLASRLRLPAIYAERAFIPSGGLMCYDTDIVDLFRRGASYVDRILRGELPGDLPVQLPTKYDLVINLKTANALGLTLNPGLLAITDEVIE